MQSTVAQVFSLAYLDKISVDDLRTRLGKEKYFYIDGITRMFNAHVLKYVDNLRDLYPSLTIIHPPNTYHVSRKLLLRISGYFRELEQAQGNVTSADSYNVGLNISQKGLEHIIDTSQGRGQHLDQLDDAILDQVIYAAADFKVERVLRTASKLVRLRAMGLNVQNLMAFSTRIHSLSKDFGRIFTPFFGLHLQRLIMRSQFVKENDLQTLIDYLATTKLPLELEFKHWKIDPEVLSLLSTLKIRKLNLLFCNGIIDLSRFTKLRELRGSMTNFTNVHSCQQLKLLNVDAMPAQLPRSLRELTLRDATPKPSELPRKLKRLSLHRQIDAAELPTLENEKVESLKITSRSGNISLDTIRQIGFWNLSQLTLIKVSMPPHLTLLPALDSLRDVTLEDCDTDIQKWILSSSNLAKIHLKIDDDKAFTYLPKSLAELTLDFNGPARALSMLSQLGSLESLRLSHIRWTEGGLGVLSNLTSLRDLSIRTIGAFIPGDTSSLTRLPHLKSFSYDSHASCFPTTEKELNDLAKLSSIRLLKIRPAQNLLPALDQLTHLDKMEILDLFGTKNLEWKHLPKFTSLKELRLRGCRWINVDSTSNLSCVPNLRHLEIPQFEGEKADLFQKITSLETLILGE